MEQLNDEELQEVEGGAAGYGNVQYTCACGKVILTEKSLIKHIEETKHKDVTVYYQQKKGQSSQGRKIGKLKIKITNDHMYGNKKTLDITYPNGQGTITPIN